MLAYTLLVVVIGLGLVETVGRNALGGGYDYRATVAVWFRSIVFFHPEPDEMVGIPILYQLHAATAWLIVAVLAARARLEHPPPVRRPAVHPLPAPVGAGSATALTRAGRCS
jgi:nitrate reductase gamma subunit